MTKIIAKKTKLMKSLATNLGFVTSSVSVFENANSREVEKSIKFELKQVPVQEKKLRKPHLMQNADGDSIPIAEDAGENKP